MLPLTTLSPVDRKPAVIHTRSTILVLPHHMINSMRFYTELTKTSKSVVNSDQHNIFIHKIFGSVIIRSPNVESTSMNPNHDRQTVVSATPVNLNFKNQSKSALLLLCSCTKSSNPLCYLRHMNVEVQAILRVMKLQLETTKKKLENPNFALTSSPINRFVNISNWAHFDPYVKASFVPSHFSAGFGL